ncbi:response regulator [Aliiglaciecola lipolytica]|uniref:Two-component system, NarL family, response regulator NreC n=1 Tax=Aliiglaciecola lipolytica E3 TaxID=1127673 RepID=K6XWV4_9ALTE|nr:response regulator transcription factor [Aliiglaciecola lipolytica]GAC16141.1 two-component system, NarL family, response regulator NreC [Aliiglaciecola lipolytica E3]
MSISFVIADDHVLMRQGLIQLLSADSDLKVIGECGDGIALIELVLKLNPDVVVMDISMPHMSGLVAIDKLLAQRPDSKVLVLSMHDEQEYIEAMREAGAKGYILKESSGDKLISAIKAVANGRTTFPDSVEKNLDMHNTTKYLNPVSVLTRREREVFFLVVAGNTSRKIAELLAMSLKTAENHRSNIYKKLQVSSSAELVRLAGKAGLLE